MQNTTINIIEQAPVGIITFSANGEIEYVNQNVRKLGVLYNFELSSLQGINIFEASIFPIDLIKDELFQLVQGFPFEKEVHSILTNDGREIDLIVKGSPLYSDDRFSGGIIIIEDIKVTSETKRHAEIKTDYIEKAIYKINELLIVTNSRYEVQFAAGSALKDFNLSGKDIYGKNITELFTNDTKLLISEKIENTIQNIESSDFVFDFTTGRKQLSFKCKIEPVLNKRGKVHLLFFFFNNITPQVEEKSILTKKVDEFNYYKSIINNLSDALFVLDKDGKIVYWDDQSEKLFGLSRSEVKGKFFGSTLELFDKRFFENIKSDLKREKIWKVNLNIFGKEKNKEIFEAKFSYAGNNEDAIIVLCSNITKRIREEEELKSSFDEYKKLIANTSELICKLDDDGNITFANQTFLDKLGYTSDEIKQLNFNSLIAPSFFEHNLFNLKSFDKVNPTHLELPIVTKEGSRLKSNTVFLPEKIRETPTSFICYISNVVEEEKKDENELLYPSLFKVAIDGIAVETEGRIAIANDSFAKIFGYESGEELSNKDLLDFVSNDDILKVAEYFRLKEHNKSAPDRFEFLGKKKNNSYFFTELSISSFELNDKNYIVMVTRDVTERKRAQKAIRESEEKYRNITDNIDDFLYTFEKVGNFMRPLFYTAAVEKITGYSQAEFLSDTKLFLKVIHPDDFQRVKKRLSKLMKSRVQNSAEMDFRIINKQGNIVWIRNKVNVTRNASGELQRVYGLVSDITLSKRAEEGLKKSTEELVKLNETKDRFISIVSHDLRTPFSSILGFTDLLLHDEELTPAERKQYVSYIQDSSKSMLSLVNSLLDWTRLQTGRIKFEPEKVDVQSMIEKSINLIRGSAMQKGVEIYSTIGKGNFVFVDTNLISQVFNNLLSNAIKFTTAGDKIILSVKRSTSLRFLEFSVKDTGQGIKEENLDKLFRVDTKFTTEGTGGEKGSGLGLSLVKEIIEKHGGIVWVESEYGKGSNFKFTLPVASATILIVDANKTDRLLYSKILKNITPDYTVDVASSGKEALEKIKASPPALVISDHNMHELGGYELVQELIKEGIFGKPPVIILSSDINRNIIQDYNDLGVEFVFQKPVNLRNFKQAVEKSLRKALTNNH